MLCIVLLTLCYLLTTLYTMESFVKSIKKFSVWLKYNIVYCINMWNDLFLERFKKNWNNAKQILTGWDPCLPDMFVRFWKLIHKLIIINNTWHHMLYTVTLLDISGTTRGYKILFYCWVRLNELILYYY